MASMHRELVNNNVLFVDEGCQGQKTLQTWHDNDADEVRDQYIYLWALFYGTQNIFPVTTQHKRFGCKRLHTKG